MNELIKQKKALRKYIYSLQNSISKDEESAENESIISLIKNDENFQQAKYIMAFWPMPNEVDVRQLIKNFSEKIWFLPSIENGILVLKRFCGEENLVVSNHYGIFEPNGVAEEVHNLIEYVIVPGVAFSKEGFRIGHGKGYYDRLLPQLANSHKVGVGFSYQYSNEIPMGSSDFVLDKVIFGNH